MNHASPSCTFPDRPGNPFLDRPGNPFLAEHLLRQSCIAELADPQPTIGELMDHAGRALDDYTLNAGTTDDDRVDVEYLIVDLLHFLDDLHLLPGQNPLVPAMLLQSVLHRYRAEAYAPVDAS